MKDGKVVSSQSKDEAVHVDEETVAPPTGAVRIQRVELENWRNFRKVDVALSRRVFLVGPNAAGKSNFIDALRFLFDIARVGGGLRSAVAARGGTSGLRCLAARRYSDIVLEVVLGTEAQPEYWRYRLAFSQSNLRLPVIRDESVWCDGKQLLNRPNTDDEDDPERLSQTYLEQVNVNRDFRQISDVFAAIRYKHLVPQLIREPDRSVGKVDDPFGGDFLEQIASTVARTRDARLRRISAAMKVALPQLLELELERDERGTPHIRGRFEHWRPQGAWQSEAQFSDGSLRLLGLLWALLDGSGPLLLEEPELSLHPEVVRQLPQMIHRLQRSTGRQVIISTHSPDLIDDPGIGLDEVILLLPSPEGTEMRPAVSLDDAQVLLGAGLNMSEILLAWTRPDKAEQLALFVD